MRKSLAVLSVLLLLTVLRCMGTCIACDMATSVPPCHGHRNPVPCPNHPGLLAFSIHQPTAQPGVPVNSPLALDQPAPRLRAAGEFRIAGFAHSPPLPRPDALSGIVLRI